MQIFIKKYFQLSIYTFIVNIAIAQKSNTGCWLAYVGNHSINKKYNWYNDVQYRNYNFTGDLQQLILRTGIGYSFANNNNVLLGYAFVNTQNYLADKVTKNSIFEHRLFQQFLTKQNFGIVLLQHRYRLEERFFSTNFQLRFRYSISTNIPLNNKKMLAKTWYASASNELFINTKAPHFDRDRLYAGIGYLPNKNVKLEIGFMAQSLELTSRNQLQIVIHNSLPLHK